MSEHFPSRSSARPRLAMVLMTLGAWLVAFVVVLALLTVLGDELESLPLALRALLISGVLVSLMANLVMPVLSGAIARWLGGGPRDSSRPSARQLASRGGAEDRSRALAGEVRRRHLRSEDVAGQHRCVSGRKNRGQLARSLSRAGGSS